MRLGVNIDHIATIRQARRGRWPDPVEAALACERAGASSIVCHLREDRRHIQDDDVRRLNAAIGTRLNLEMSASASVVKTALVVRPHQVTLVPERRQELTTEGGLDVMKFARPLGKLVKEFQTAGIEVSVFVDPVPSQLVAAQQTGATIIELHTGRYALADTAAGRTREWEALARAARLAARLGVAVAAGHGLDYQNVPAVVRIPEIGELNIGFSIVGRALTVGLTPAVREMVRLTTTPMRKRNVHALEAASF